MAPARTTRIEVRTGRRAEWVEITQRVAEVVSQAGWREGFVHVFIPHTTAGVTINENADPSVASDMINFLDKLVPRQGDFTHAEGNSDAHIKASLMGCSVRVNFSGARLNLGRWQGIFFCEFDGPRHREVWVTVEPTSESAQAGATKEP